MNPMTNIKNLQKLNERELELGIIGKKSWHDEYKDSAWIFIGGLPYDLSEGDIICVFSQYGELVNINLVRDNKTGKSKGYAFICFQDQRSTVLSVDNLNGIKILGRTIRVDHVKDYKMPKERGDEDDTTLKLRQEGIAPRIESSSPEEVEEVEEETTKKKRKKEKKKKVKKEKSKKKKKEKDSSEEEDSSSESEKEEKNAGLSNSDAVKKEKVDIKEEKMDSGYDKAFNQYSGKMKRSRHDSTDDDDSESKDRKHRVKNGVKEERWGDRDGERRRGDGGWGGSDRRDRRDNQSQRYDDRDRGHRDEVYGDGRKDNDNRDYDRRVRDGQFDGSGNSNREHRDRDREYGSRDRNDDFREREDGRVRGQDDGGSSSRGRARNDDKDDVQRHRRPVGDRNGGDSDGERRKESSSRGRRSRSSSRDRSQNRKRKHRSRSRSRER